MTGSIAHMRFIISLLISAEVCQTNSHRVNTFEGKMVFKGENAVDLDTQPNLQESRQKGVLEKSKLPVKGRVLDKSLEYVLENGAKFPVDAVKNVRERGDDLDDETLELMEEVFEELGLA